MSTISLEETKRIINKIFKQANAGYFEIDSTDSKYSGPWKYFSKFYAKVNGVILKNGEDIFAPATAQFTITEDDFKTPIIQIPDAEAFANMMQNYLQIAEDFYLSDKAKFAYYDESFREKLVLDIFMNTTNFDRHNILSYLETRTKMIETPLKTRHFLLDQTPDFAIKASVLKNPSMLEAPYRFTTYFECENEDKFFLPSITFGIIENTVYIYAIQAKREKQTNAISKKLDRYMRKVNKDVDMEDIIGQVSPSALVALTIFMSAIKKEGIKTVVAPNFMPLRYQTNLMGEENYFKRSINGETDKKMLDDILEKVEEKHNRQQFAITNKFTYTLLRYCHHFDGCKFDYDSIREQSVITLSKENSPQDNIIQDIDKICKSSLGLKEADKQK